MYVYSREWSIPLRLHCPIRVGGGRRGRGRKLAHQIARCYASAVISSSVYTRNAVLSVKVRPAGTAWRFGTGHRLSVYTKCACGRTLTAQHGRGPVPFYPSHSRGVRFIYLFTAHSSQQCIIYVCVPIWVGCAVGESAGGSKGVPEWPRVRRRGACATPTCGRRGHTCVPLTD